MLKKCIEENRMASVRHLLEIKRIRNPERLVRLENGLYRHTNNRGATKMYRVYDTFERYRRSADYAGGKLFHVNGFCIVEKPCTAKPSGQCCENSK